MDVRGMSSRSDEADHAPPAMRRYVLVMKPYKLTMIQSGASPWPVSICSCQEINIQPVQSFSHLGCMLWGKSRYPIPHS